MKKNKQGKLNIPRPGSMEREHMTHPFRGTSPSPGFFYPSVESSITKKNTTIEPKNEKISNIGHFKNETKATALRRLAEIYKESQSIGRPTAFLEELYIKIRNSILKDTDKLYFDDESYQNYVLLNQEDYRELYDRETGEPLKMTNSIWTSKEGRLDVDMPSILGMATGKLNIENRAVNGDYIYCGAKAATPIKISPVKFTKMQPNDDANHIKNAHTKYSNSHMMFEEFMNKGPLTPIHHRFWSAKSGIVEFPLDQMPEEGNDSKLRLNSAESVSENFKSLFSSTQEVVPLNPLLIDAYDPKSTSQNNTIDIEIPLGRKISPPNINLVDQTQLQSDHDMLEDITRAHTALKTRGDHNRTGGSKSGKRQAHIPEDKPNDSSVIPENLRPQNKIIWAALEKKIYQEIFEKINELEYNKKWTGEKEFAAVYIKDYRGRVASQENPVHAISREIAKMRVRNLKEVVQAVADEEVRDTERRNSEDSCKNSNQLKDMLKIHEKERNDHKTYIETLQCNNEIILINKLGSYGLLW